MADQQLQAFIQAVRQDDSLQVRLSSTVAADADEVAAIAQDSGFEVSPSDLVAYADGALVEYEDEDYFMKPSWWQLGA